MANSKKDPQPNPKRFQLLTPPAPFFASFAQGKQPSPKEVCKLLEDQLNAVLKRNCEAKFNQDATGSCAGGNGGAGTAVDLVVVIDTSGSMGDEATDLSNAANAAISAAAQQCPSDLRVDYFGIEGTWAGTLFTQSYRDYLQALPTPIPDADIVGTPGINGKEDGAAAVIDLSDHYDWRAGAARIIFYLGDEALEGGDPQDAGDEVARNAAVTAATNANVTVFTYLGTGNVSPDTVTDYTKLATDTSGQPFSAPIANLGGFEAVLAQIICSGAKGPCKEVARPEIAPCIKLSWGDGAKDQLETDDVEILCLTVSNPYTNLTLKDVTLHLVVLDEVGNTVPSLPDGTPSVEIKPNFMICFGDLAPCHADKPDVDSSASREVVLMNRGAKSGTYRVYLVYCFEASFTYLGVNSSLKLPLVIS
ncbi:MAG: hypothetical protein AAFR61_18730 [Bacteroidota bacterium]